MKNVIFGMFLFVAVFAMGCGSGPTVCVLDEAGQPLECGDIHPLFLEIAADEGIATSNYMTIESGTDGTFIDWCREVLDLPEGERVFYRTTNLDSECLDRRSADANVTCPVSFSCN